MKKFKSFWANVFYQAGGKKRFFWGIALIALLPIICILYYVDLHVVQFFKPWHIPIALVIILTVVCKYESSFDDAISYDQGEATEEKENC